MKFTKIGVALGALLALLLLVAVSAIVGGISLGVTGGVVAAILYFIGVVNLATAQAVFLGFVAVGAAIGVLRGLLVMLMGGQK